MLSKETFSAQRRHIKELKTLLTELDAKLQLEDREVEKLKRRTGAGRDEKVFAGGGDS